MKIKGNGWKEGDVAYFNTYIEGKGKKATNHNKGSRSLTFGRR
jgi:hypothetical protein